MGKSILKSKMASRNEKVLNKKMISRNKNVVKSISILCILALVICSMVSTLNIEAAGKTNLSGLNTKGSKTLTNTNKSINYSTPITKEFTDPSKANKYLNVDDQVQYTITGVIDPSKIKLKNDNNYIEFVFTDHIDKRFTFINNDSAYLSVEGSNSKEKLGIKDGKDLVFSDAEELDKSSILKWTLTRDGVDKVLSIIGNKQKKIAIQITFTLELNDKATGGTNAQIVSKNNAISVIDNGATLDIKDAKGRVEPQKMVEQKEQPKLHLAGLEINKYKAVAGTVNADINTPLAGAKFKIADSKENAKSGKYLKDYFGVDIEVTTGDNPKTEDVEVGWGMFTAIPISEGKKYYLVETQAPDGYVKRDSILEINFTGEEVATKHKVEQIVNQKNGDPAIPEEKQSSEAQKIGSKVIIKKQFKAHKTRIKVIIKTLCWSFFVLFYVIYKKRKN
ncbi:MAG: hypothetical protein LBR30_07995, partial [Clostridioides sp.]|nr:hypothetical protein [Clostridioides sp.]